MSEAEGDLPARRTAKSEAAFRTISEVAEELDVPQHVLRFWESKFPQVKPLKRGGGRRYYRPEDVALLRKIRDLLYSEGYTIKGVQKLLKEGAARDAGPAPAARPAPESLPLLPEPEHDPEPEADDVPDDDVLEDDGPDMDDGDADAESDESYDEPGDETVPFDMDEDPEPEMDMISSPQQAPLAAAPAPVPAPESGRLSPALRAELETIVGELEQIRVLLQPRDR